MVHLTTNSLLAYKIDPGPFIDPGTNGAGVAEKIISNIIGILTAVAFIYFVIQTIIAAYQYISSEGDKAKIKSSRKRITEGVLGLVIAVIALGLGALFASLLGLKNIFDLNQMFNSMGL